MAVLTYKGGKYRNLTGNKIYDGTEWRDMTGNSKIFLDGKWRNFSWMTENTDIPEGEAPVYPGVPGPELTEDNLVHVQTEQPSGTVWYVTPGGSGTKDGTSWDNAFSASQIHVAMLSCQEGDAVFMMEGYFGKLDRPAVIPAGVSVYGGFPAADPIWEKRNGFAFATTWEGNKNFAPFVCSGSQHLIDGICLKDFSGEATDSQSAVIRNCTFSGGGFSFSGSMNNCKATDCSICIGGDAERVVVVNTRSSDFLVTGNVLDATLFLLGGKFKAADVGAAYICNCDTEVNSLVNSTVVEGEITTGSVETSFIAGSKKAFAETVKNCTVLESSTQFDDVSESTLYNCQNTIADITDCKITNGIIEHIPCINQGLKANGYYLSRGRISYLNSNYLITLDGWGWTELCGFDFSADQPYFAVRNGDLYVGPTGGKFELINNEVRWENIKYVVGYGGKKYVAMLKDGVMYVLVNGKLYIYDDQIYDSIMKFWLGGSVYMDMLVNVQGAIQYWRIFPDGTKKKISAGPGINFPPDTYKYKKAFLTNYSDGAGTYDTPNEVDIVGVTEDNIFCYYGKEMPIRDIDISPLRDDGNYRACPYITSDGRLAYFDWRFEESVELDVEGRQDFVRIYCQDNTYYFAITATGEMYKVSLILTSDSPDPSWEAIDIKGWGELSGWNHNLPLYGICGGTLYSVSGSGIVPRDYVGVNSTRSDTINCGCSYISGMNSRFINSSSDFFRSEANTLFVNCRGDISESTYSTVVNSDTSLQSGSYNVFWNNNGTAPAANNAQSAYASDNILTLGSNNDIARFEKTGYYPAIGPQDTGKCPDPLNDPEGYNAYVTSFGDWHPKNNSFLIGKGVKLEQVADDIEGKERSETPALGAYEPVPAEVTE